jgi:hypothetical protein
MSDNKSNNTLSDIVTSVAIIIVVILIIRWMVTTKEGFITGVVLSVLIVMGSLFPPNEARLEQSQPQYYGENREEPGMSALTSDRNMNIGTRVVSSYVQSSKPIFNDIPRGATGGCITSGSLTECSYRQ